MSFVVLVGKFNKMQLFDFRAASGYDVVSEMNGVIVGDPMAVLVQCR